MSYEFKDQLDKKIKNFAEISKRIKKDASQLSCESWFGLMYHEDVDASCSISTFGNDEEFEIDVYDGYTDTQSVYEASECEEALNDFKRVVARYTDKF